MAAAVPDLSDRLCSERMKELEARGIVEREVHPGPPVRVSYALTDMGDALGPLKLLTILRAMQDFYGDPRYRPSPWLTRRR